MQGEVGGEGVYIGENNQNAPEIGWFRGALRDDTEKSVAFQTKIAASQADATVSYGHVLIKKTHPYNRNVNNLTSK